MYHCGAGIDSWEGCASVETGDIWELSLLSLQFCFELKTILKIKAILFISKTIFYWSIVDLQCCVNFCCTAKWVSYIYIYIYIYIFFFIFFSIMIYPRILNICCLSILYVTACIY